MVVELKAANACIYDIVRIANLKNISENQFFSVQLFVLLLVQSTIWERLTGGLVTKLKLWHAYENQNCFYWLPKALPLKRAWQRCCYEKRWLVTP
jgi:hypothetical protein